MLMKNKFTLVAACMMFAGGLIRASAADVLTVAVFDFESKDESVHGLGPKISAVINADLSAEPQLITVEREELAKVLGEQELGLSGTVSPDSAAKVGHLTGAKVLVTGRVFQVDNGLILVAKIIGTETSRVYGEVVHGRAGADITELSGELARKIAADVTGKGDTLVAKTESMEERIGRINKSLKDGKRRSVSVRIEERHFGQPVIDPAAETELTAIFQKVGFTVIDDKSTNKPDVEITGQAFSAYGLRKGNLISCRSRIELKAHERSSGKILAADSQTSVAVDIAEQTAAKSALENAAAEIAERLAPKLIQ
jgi:TolB-like protein